MVSIFVFDVNGILYDCIFIIIVFNILISFFSCFVRFGFFQEEMSSSGFQ